MVAKRKALAAPRAGELRINLFAPGMSPLHRAGLAGLWATLQALETDAAAMHRLRSVGGAWELEPQAVVLRWLGDGRSFFDTLLRASFRVHNSGLIELAAFGPPIEHSAHAVTLHKAVLGTFLQHGRTRKADSSAKPGGVWAVTIDESEPPVVDTFQRVFSYAHQEAGFDPTRPVALVGWQYPGAGARHVALPVTALQEPPERALALLYAPAGVIYFQIRSRRARVRPQYCMVIPDIENLPAYVQTRLSITTFSAQQLQVSGMAQAALRVLVTLESKGLLTDLGGDTCRAVAFGIVPWVKQQKTRVDVFTVIAGRERQLEAFRAAEQLLPPRLVRPQRQAGRSGQMAQPWLNIPQAPELIARNVAAGRPWWRDFAAFVESLEPKERAKVFINERGGLHGMVEKVLDGGPERIFVRACHEAWRRRLGKLAERAAREHLSFRDLASREFDRTRVSFTRCKSAPMLRQAVTDFWARGGHQPALQDGWADILPFLGKRWSEGKDLALLAMASYAPASKDEARALSEGADDGNTAEGE